MRHHAKKNWCQSFRAVLAAIFFVAVSSLLATAQLQAAAITGTVGAASGGLAGQWVDVFDCNAASPGYGSGGGYIKSGETGAGGAYSIDVTPGQYRIAVLLGTTYVDYWYKDKTSPNDAECVLVPAEGKALDPIVLVQVADNSGSISGTVSQKIGGLGIPEVIVYAHAVSSNDVLTAKTDSGGLYKIQAVKPGEYTVEFGASATGYVNAWYDLNADKVPDKVTVSSATETQNINVSLDAGGTISGKVTVGSLTGPGVSTAWVDVCESGSTVCSGTTQIGYAQTDSNGIYTVKGLPPGKQYLVQFHEKTVQNAGAGVTQFYDNKQNIGEATAVDVNSAGINAVFPGAVISGMVTKSGGTGIAGVIVKAYDSNGAVAALSAATGDDGLYKIEGLRRGSYKLHFQAFKTGYISEWHNDKVLMNLADPVAITSLGDTLSGRDAELAPGGTISGSVKDKDGKPIVGALVKVYDSSDSSALRGIAVTGENGNYTVTGLPPGSNKAHFFEYKGSDDSGYGKNEWYDDKPDFISATAVNTGDAGIDAVLERTSQLAPMYNLLLLKKRCVDANGTPVYCSN